MSGVALWMICGTASAESITFDEWLRQPSATRFVQLVKMAKSHTKAKLVFIDELAPEDSGQTTYMRAFSTNGVVSKCEIVSIFNDKTRISTFVKRNRDVVEDKQLLLLMEGLVVAHELGHCVARTRKYSLPVELRDYEYKYKLGWFDTTVRTVKADIRYHEMYADLYGLALLSKRLSKEHFYAVVAAMSEYRSSRYEPGVSHNTLPMLTDLDEAAYDQLRGIPLEKIPEIVHQVAVEHIRRDIADKM